MISETPPPPYYAVIFSSIKNKDDIEYSEMSSEMIELAMQQEGFLGIESARENIGITVSYWNSLESIKKWKNNSEHLVAQELGKKKWYSRFKVRIALVEKDYGFSK